MELAEKVYKELKDAGVDALLDDRKDRAGVKFKDADLIGYPIRITVGPKTVEEDVLELKVRRTGETVTVSVGEAAGKTVEMLTDL